MTILDGSLAFISLTPPFIDAITKVTLAEDGSMKFRRRLALSYDKRGSQSSSGRRDKVAAIHEFRSCRVLLHGLQADVFDRGGRAVGAESQRSIAFDQTGAEADFAVLEILINDFLLI